MATPNKGTFQLSYLNKMTHILKNDILEVHVDFPTDNYNHSRFDWTGKIVKVKFKGKSISGTETIDQTKDHSLGKGFYNEFGIDSPLGFDHLNIGEWFHKIGVGLLKKDSTHYNFHERYEIQPADFDIIPESDKIRIKCQSQSINGYSYFLKKEISLLKSGFEVKYYIENRGRNPIVTTEYNHNFITVDRDLIGEGYILKFPFRIMTELFNESINPEQLVEFGEKEIRFLGTPKEPIFFSNLSGGELVDGRFELINTKSKIGISETGSFKTNSINLWGASHVICPELFINIDVAAGQSKTWSRTYQVFETN